jgi:hypothetical protein
MNYITSLFNVQAPTCFGSSLPSSGSFLDPCELLEQIGGILYNVYVACVLEACTLNKEVVNTYQDMWPTMLISNVMSILNLFFYMVVMNMASNTSQLSYRKKWVTTATSCFMGWLEVLEKSKVLDKQLQHTFRDHYMSLSLRMEPEIGSEMFRI